MMRALAVAGLLLWTSPVFAESTLYERVREITDRRFTPLVEPEVGDFITALFAGSDPPLTEQDIDRFLKGDYQYFCQERTDFAECDRLRADIRMAVNRERRVREAGRELYLAASAHEFPLGEHFATEAAIGPKLQSLLNIWQAGTDEALTPNVETRIRLVTLPEPQPELEALYAQLEQQLVALAPGTGIKQRREFLAAIVARYRYGALSVFEHEGECAEDFDNPFLFTELHRMGMRYCEIEETARQIWDRLILEVAVLDPPLQANEHAWFPTETFDDLNIVVWANDDDVGIAWKFPMEPVLPMLVSDADYELCMAVLGDDLFCGFLAERDVVLGGRYPDPPEDPEQDAGLCGQIHAREGYLCRPQVHAECIEGAQTSSSSSSQARAEASASSAPAGRIELTACRTPPMDGPVSMRPHGPDICGIGGWRLKENAPGAVLDSPQRDEAMVPGECSDCAVDFYCAPECGGADLHVLEKDEKGVIPVCLNSVAESLPSLRYLALHAMARAQQSCRNPAPAPGDQVSCCAMEYEAGYVQCGALAEDGLLADISYDADGEGPAKPQTLSLSVDACAALMANLGCAQEDGGPACAALPWNAARFWQGLRGKIDAEAERLGLPRTCEEAVQNLDARVLAMKDALPSACTPECQTRYKNSIGNNLCFIGQCIEQSVEEQRLVPGRMPFVGQDAAFPWDACYLPDPIADAEDPSVTPLLVPALHGALLPAYDPEGVVRQLDIALCQLYGLPASGNPAQCAVNLSRRLDMTLADWLEMSSAVAEAVGDNLDPAKELQRLGAGIGGRLGADLYVNVLGPSQRSIADLFSTTAAFLEKIASTSFPNQMCSRTMDSCPYR